MAWSGCVTDAGKNALQQYLAGLAEIRFDLVKLGNGHVQTGEMKEQTDIQNLITTGTIQKVEYMETGTRFRLAFSSYGSEGYTLREVGLFASVTIDEVTTSVLMGLYQDSDGIAIPNHDSFPDYVYVLSVIIPIINNGNLEIVIPPDAYVPMSEFEETVEELKTKINRMVYNVSATTEIYTTVANVNPELLFEGTQWERIEDRFLLAAGENHAAGSQGGKEDYVAADMPKHTHGAGSYYPSASGSFIMSGPVGLVTSEGIVSGESPYSSSVHGDTSAWYAQRIRLRLNQSNSSVGGTSGPSGTNESAKILPPYLTVYMWIRVA